MSSSNLKNETVVNALGIINDSGNAKREGTVSGSQLNLQPYSPSFYRGTITTDISMVTTDVVNVVLRSASNVDIYNGVHVLYANAQVTGIEVYLNALPFDLNQFILSWSIMTV